MMHSYSWARCNINFTMNYLCDTNLWLLTACILLNVIGDCEMYVVGLDAAVARVFMWTSQRLAEVGQDAQLYCRASGSPSPTVTWYDSDDQEVLPDDNQYKVTALTLSSSVVIIHVKHRYHIITLKQLRPWYFSHALLISTRELEMSYIQCIDGTSAIWSLLVQSSQQLELLPDNVVYYYPARVSLAVWYKKRQYFSKEDTSRNECFAVQSICGSIHNDNVLDHLKTITLVFVVLVCGLLFEKFYT